MPILVGGLGKKKSNGGSQYYQQDRIYSSVTDALACCYGLDSYLYLVVKNEKK